MAVLWNCSRLSVWKNEYKGYLLGDKGGWCRSHCPRGVSRGSAATRLLELWVRIPLGPRLSAVSVVCFQVEFFCVELITRLGESYWVCCVWVWSWIVDNEEALVQWGLLHHGKKGRLVRRDDDITTLMCWWSLNLRAPVFWVCFNCTYFATRHCLFQNCHELQLVVSWYVCVLFKNICLKHPFKYFVDV